MYSVYKITCLTDGAVYVGMTSHTLEKRFHNHKWNAKRGTDTKLYNHMRKHGLDNYRIEFIMGASSREECSFYERGIIAIFKVEGLKVLNLAKGGDGGWVVQDVESWKEKCRKSRQGAKPALGMKHSEENKLLFSKVSRTYWDSQDTYDAVEVLKYGFTEANKIFGISKTHYYRLRKIPLDNSQNLL